MDVSSEMIQKGELAWFVWGFKHYGVEPEYIYKFVCVCRIQISILIKQSNTPSVLSSFDNKLNRSCIKPFLTLVNPRRQRSVVKSAALLLSKFHLNIEATTPCGPHNLTRIEIAISKSLSTFNASHSDIRTEVQVCRKFPLNHGNFKRPSARHGGNCIRAGQPYLRSGCGFIRY